MNYGTSPPGMAQPKKQGAFYNLTKYRLFTAVKILNLSGVPATTFSIAILMGRKQKAVTDTIHRCKSYFIVRHLEGSPDSCRVKYRLSAKGERVRLAYQERHREGLDLKIRKVPEKQDWSDVVMLPNYEKKLEKLQEFYS